MGLALAFVLAVSFALSLAKSTCVLRVGDTDLPLVVGKCTPLLNGGTILIVVWSLFSSNGRKTAHRQRFSYFPMKTAMQGIHFMAIIDV